MPQYLADIKETEFFLTQQEAHHVGSVVRHKEGDEILVFDGTGRQYRGRIEKIQKNFVRGVLLQACEVRRPALCLTLCFVPNSRTGLEEVLDKGTQLGVAVFQPLVSARSEYDLFKKWDGKNTRWHQIMLAACKQCNTPFLPEILPPARFEQIITRPAASLFAYEAEKEHSLAWGLARLGSPSSVRVFIGPAGGWTAEEAALARAHRAYAVSLGVNILRAETACIAAAAKLL